MPRCTDTHSWETIVSPFHVKRDGSHPSHQRHSQKRRRVQSRQENTGCNLLRTEGGDGRSAAAEDAYAQGNGSIAIQMPEYTPPPWASVNPAAGTTTIRRGPACSLSIQGVPRETALRRTSAITYRALRTTGATSRYASPSTAGASAPDRRRTFAQQTERARLSSARGGSRTRSPLPCTGARDPTPEAGGPRATARGACVTRATHATAPCCT